MFRAAVTSIQKAQVGGGYKEERTLRLSLCMTTPVVPVVCLTQTKIKSQLEGNVRGLTTESRERKTQMASMEDTLTGQLAEIKRRLIEQADESQRQFEAVSHAVHSFAEIMNVTPAS